MWYEFSPDLTSCTNDKYAFHYFAKTTSVTEKIIIDPAAWGFLDLASTKIISNSDIHNTFMNYIGAGYNADMDYLERNVDKRMDPSLMVDEAQTVISFLAPYGKARQGVAGFAQGEDYHTAVRRRLHSVEEFLSDKARELGLPEYKGRCFVDSAPVLERFWAARAGLGFIGRNGFLISPSFGLRTIIGEIICNIPVELFEPHPPLRVTSCGDCGRCKEACPTSALLWREDGTSLVDARKCISYHTIESKDKTGSVPVDCHGWIFGCEECLNACPWNKDVPSWAELEKNAGFLVNLTREKWLEMDQDTFDSHFSDSGLKRAGLEKIKSNL